ncbi:MAG: hypothetical protein ACRDLL_16770, partial [Solirubrobacterales bacterium]
TVTTVDPMDGLVFCALCGRTRSIEDVNGAGSRFAVFEALMTDNGNWSVEGSPRKRRAGKAS